MRGLNFDQLHTLVQVIERGSFSAAAEHLALTQPAVSLQIRQLERRVGLRLVERVGRRARPTAAGAELVQHIRRIEAAVAGALEAMAYRTEGVVGRVRLGTGATACIYLLLPLLRDLRSRFPHLEIVVSTANTPVILKALEENAIDVAVVTLPAGLPVFAVTPLVDDEIVAVFAADGEAPPATLTAARLARLPVVLYEPGGNSRRVIDDWFRDAGIALKPAMELGNIEAIKELVAAGLGCGLLPRLAVRGAAAEAGIRVRSLTPPLHRRLALVLRRDKVPDRGLREFVRALESLRAPGSAG